jgi:hypothetical protein
VSRQDRRCGQPDGAHAPAGRKEDVPVRSHPAGHGIFAIDPGRRSMIVRAIIMTAITVAIGAAVLLASNLEGTLRALLGALG